MFIFQTFFQFARLTFGTFFPIIGRDFVSADVNIFAREQLANFGQDIL